MSPPTLSRKQREIAEREGLILDVARTMLLERGYLGLTMERIADEAEYSKGTIYQHFSCKEDVMAAMAIQSADVRTGLFERASFFRGRARERMAAIGHADELFVQLFPHHFHADMVIDGGSIREKVSPERRAQLDANDFRCLSIITGIIRDGISAGDLTLSEGDTPEDLLFGLWSMATGSHLIEAKVPLAERGIPDPMGTLRRNESILLDGHGWAPLSNEWDYDATHERIAAEVFADEHRQLERR